MKVAIAGGTGFVGRHVVAALRAAGHRVVILARGAHEPPSGADVDLVACDVGAGPPPPDALRGCDALVNLVGIKREQGAQTFERAHVEATRHLLAAARAAGIRRFVHVSVVASRPDARSAYHDTKWRAEQLVRASGLDWTILRPGVIYGRGDDLVTHLVKMIRFAPIFPVVGTGRTLVQPIAVETVAMAVLRTLERDAAIGQTYALVGHGPMRLTDVVRTVAEAVGLRVWIVWTPIWLQRAAVHVMNALAPRPLSTPAQLQMLVDGLTGDPAPARQALGVAAPPFTVATVRALAGGIPPRCWFSLRLAPDDARVRGARSRDSDSRRALALAAVAIVLLWALSAVIPNVWARMLAFYAVLAPAAVAFRWRCWRSLLTPARWQLALGAASAVALYAAGWLVLVGATALAPALGAELAALYAWRDQLPHPAVGPALVALIVAGEEVLWRGAISLPLGARWGVLGGTLLAALAFGAAHLGFGSLLLVAAAVGAGAVWAALTLATRSLVPALVCHLLWDLAVFFWLPY